MKVYNKQEEKTSRSVKLFGITIYHKSVQESSSKVRFLGNLVQIFTLEDFIEVYILGIRFYRKMIPLKQSHYHALLKRIDDVYYNMSVFIQTPFVHKYFIKYKGCNRGKDIFCIAGGPTVKYFNHKAYPKALKCGVNGIIALVDNLDYLFVEDTFVRDRNVDKEIDEYKGNNCQKFYGLLPHRRVRELNKVEHFTDRIAPMRICSAGANVFLIADIVREKWATDLEVEPFGDFQGAVLSALQFLLYTHPRRIFLVGNDCSDGEIAYHSDRAPANINHSGKIRCYRSLKKFVTSTYPDIQIVSINPVGLKGMFRDVYTRSFLQKHPEINPATVKIFEEG